MPISVASTTSGRFSRQADETCVSAAVAGTLASTIGYVPLTTDLSAWYAGVGLAGLLLPVGLAVAAFVISVGGRPLFSRMVIEE